MFRTLCSCSIVLFLVTSARAERPANPTIDELKVIAAKPHVAELTLEELRIYPRARQYSIRATMHRPEQEPNSIKMSCDEKWVDGKYIVSTFTFPGAPEPTTMIVTFDDKAICYRKWVFDGKADYGTMIGTRVGQSRSVAWGSIPDEKSPNFVLSQESHTDTSTEWSELHIKDGKIIGRVTGKAIKVD